MHQHGSRPGNRRRPAESANAPWQHRTIADLAAPPRTPDGRYIVVRGRLWRAANPDLSPERRQHLVNELMTARRAVGQAERMSDAVAAAAAHAAVHAAKVPLGERGSPWWRDGAPDLNQRMAKNTCYAEWYESILKTGTQTTL